MYYLGSRYYDVEVGRFLNADTTEILGVQSDLYDKNLYAYCDNNPVMRVDKGGAVWVDALIGITLYTLSSLVFGEEITALGILNSAVMGIICARSIGAAVIVSAAASIYSDTMNGASVGKTLTNAAISAALAACTVSTINTIKSWEISSTALLAIDIAIGTGMGLTATAWSNSIPNNNKKNNVSRQKQPKTPKPSKSNRKRTDNSITIKKSSRVNSKNIFR